MYFNNINIWGFKILSPIFIVIVWSSCHHHYCTNRQLQITKAILNRFQTDQNLFLCYTFVFHISFQICRRMSKRLMSRATIDCMASSIHQVIGRKVQLQGEYFVLFFTSHYMRKHNAHHKYRYFFKVSVIFLKTTCYILLQGNMFSSYTRKGVAYHVIVSNTNR